MKYKPIIYSIPKEILSHAKGILQRSPLEDAFGVGKDSPRESRPKGMPYGMDLRSGMDLWDKTEL